MGSDLEQTVERYHRATKAFITGDPSHQRSLWSRREDATLANPLGPPVRRWGDVSSALLRAASQLGDGEMLGIERISGYSSDDLAYIVEIERSRVKVGGAGVAVPASLRVTTIFRREDDGWRVVHRHADAITAPRPIESVVDRE